MVATNATKLIKPLWCLVGMDLAKGVRDFPPQIQIIREELLSRITASFKRHGFAPFASPVIERRETLTFKFAGDEDVMDELFELTDGGERELGLRFDLTIPLCRFVSQNRDLKLPFKRYEIGRVYRDGPIKKGRYREFWQCDADVVGSSSMLADAECIKVADDVFSQLPFDYVIKVNNRRLLDEVCVHLGIERVHDTVMLLDKLAKIGEDSVREQLGEFLSAEQVDGLFALLAAKGSDAGRLKQLEEALGDSVGVSQLREVLGFLEGLAHVSFDPTLARGLNYYTGTVYEVFLLDSPVSSSCAGGGRYDEIIGQMRGADEIPAVGVSFGIEPLTDALLAEKKRFDSTHADVFVAPIKVELEASRIADRLRLAGLNVDIDVMGRSISKNLDYADKLGIGFVVIVGERDLEAGELTLKNMRTSEETKISLDELESLDLSAFE